MLYALLLGATRIQALDPTTMNNVVDHTRGTHDNLQGDGDFAATNDGAEYDEQHRDLQFFVNTGRQKRSRGVARFFDDDDGGGDDDGFALVDENIAPYSQGGSKSKSKGRRKGERGGTNRGMSRGMMSKGGGTPFVYPGEETIVQMRESARVTRDKEILEENGWTRKRVDTIRASQIVTTLAPVATPAPTIAETAASTTNTTESGASGNTTTAPGATPGASPGATPGATPATPASAGGNTTTAPGAAPAPAPAAANGTATTSAPTAATAPDELIPLAARTAPYRGVTCSGGPEDFAFGIDIHVDFINDKFHPCSEQDFDALGALLNYTLNEEFPLRVPSWPGEVVFSSFQFDVDQFSLHINPFAGDDNNERHLLRKESSTVSSLQDGDASASSYLSTVQDRSERRRLLESTCPPRPGYCDVTTDLCIFGCGYISVTDCGDMSALGDLWPALSIAVSSLGWECLGGGVPPFVDFSLLST